MKAWTVLALMMGLSGFSAFAEEPAPCSVAVGVTTRLGTFRTWTNALETQILNEKGLGVCQDDAILKVSDEEMSEMTDEKAAKLLKCKTEFKLELLFRPDNMTRNVTIFKSGKIIFDRDYPANPTSVGSLKILRTIPTCAELQKLPAGPASGN